MVNYAERVQELNMFGISFGEIILIAIVILIVYGPEKLPELMRTAGLVLGAVQKEYNNIRREFYNSVYTPASDVKTRMDSAVRNLVSIEEKVPGRAGVPPATSSKGDSEASAGQRPAPPESTQETITKEKNDTEK